VALAAGALIAAAAPAAPLCKDLKGLFTPCPQVLNKDARHKLAQRIETAPAAPATPKAQAPPVAPRAVARSRFEPTKLCRDTKGLFTPCPQ
jgi:hypothetical protein